jgi:dTDP-4-dehydrorhamnose reductase
VVEEAQSLVLVTGAAGMLGRAVMQSVPAHVEAVPTTRADCDLAEAEHVELLFERTRPDAVIHTAGFTQVDRAEVAEEEAFRDNVDATRAVAQACGRRGLPWILISTDYVFDGRSDRPYREEDEPHPINAYGRTKLEAEREAQGATIVRTSWLYGPGGTHFPGKILALAEKRDEIDVVDDQRGCPTSTLVLAPVLWELLAVGEPGLYHAACEGSCTWFELAQAVLEGRPTGLRRCKTSEFPRPAPRPLYSVLDCSKVRALLGKPLPPWREALQEFLKA